MNQLLAWQQTEQCLLLSGQLVSHSLLPLWQQRQSLIEQVRRVDLSGLSRIDSAGLACLLRLQQAAVEQGHNLQFTGISQQLQALITLYNLGEILTPSQS